MGGPSVPEDNFEKETRARYERDRLNHLKVNDPQKYQRLVTNMGSTEAKSDYEEFRKMVVGEQRNKERDAALKVENKAKREEILKRLTETPGRRQAVLVRSVNENNSIIPESLRK